MDKVKAFKDFLEPEEARELSQWTESNYHRDWFLDPHMDSKGLLKTKLTTRFANPLVNYNNPIIDYSNMDHARCVVASSPDFEYVSLCDLTQDATFLLSPDLEKTGIELEIDVHQKTVIWVDREQIKRVLFNLMKNYVYES